MTTHRDMTALTRDHHEPASGFTGRATFHGSHRRRRGDAGPWLVVTALLSALLGSMGCAPRAGLVRPDHPLLSHEAGRPALSAPRDDVLLWDGAVPQDDDATSAARERIARVAAASVGKGPLVVDGERYRMDCSGVARGIYAQAGFKLGTVKVTGATNDTHVLFELVRRTGSLRRTNPLVGDLVFFDDTWDQNGNGRRDDPLSHVAVVERVEEDGTVLLVHRVGRSIVRARMNLAEPHARHARDGRPLNHYLRSASGAEPAKTTAELFVAYGSLPLSEAERLARR